MHLLVKKIAYLCRSVGLQVSSRSLLLMQYVRTKSNGSDTQPHPMIHRLSHDDVENLVQSFKSCVKCRLLQGYVGLDLLWERQKVMSSSAPNSNEPMLKKPLQFGRVHPFDPATDKYKVVYRDGLWTWKTELKIKNAQQFTKT
jgi:hypothetical protein